jgi:hypothetical protein
MYGYLYMQLGPPQIVNQAHVLSSLILWLYRYNHEWPGMAESIPSPDRWLFSEKALDHLKNFSVAYNQRQPKPLVMNLSKWTEWEAQQQIPMSAAARRQHAHDYARDRHEELWGTLAVTFARWDLVHGNRLYE